MFFPQFLVAQIRFCSKLEAAAKLGVASVLQLGNEFGYGGWFGDLRLGCQKEAFIPEDGLKHFIRDFHFDLSIEPPSQVINPGNLIDVGRGGHGIDEGG